MSIVNDNKEETLFKRGQARMTVDSKGDVLNFRINGTDNVTDEATLKSFLSEYGLTMEDLPGTNGEVDF